MEETIFISPDSGLPLFWNENRDQLREKQGSAVYELKEGVIQLLPKEKVQLTSHPDFDYYDHYQKDAETFDYFAGWEDPAAVHENHRLHQRILAEMRAKPGNVLDVGCGAAWVAAHFKESDVSVYSMDISAVNPQKAVARYPFEGHTGIVADVFHLPFKPAVFDFIIASEIIEHVADPPAFLGHLLRVLAPGGTLVVTTPHAEKLAYSLCIHCNQPTPHHAHLHSFTTENIRNLLPVPLRSGARTHTFMNKLLLHARTHVLLRYFPFQLWRWIDTLANLLIRKTARLMLVVRRAK